MQEKSHWLWAYGGHENTLKTPVSQMRPSMKEKIQNFPSGLQETSWHSFSGEVLLYPVRNQDETGQTRAPSYEEHCGSYPRKTDGEPWKALASGCKHLQGQRAATHFIAASMRLLQHPWTFPFQPLLGPCSPQVERLGADFKEGWNFQGHLVSAW